MNVDCWQMTGNALSVPYIHQLQYLRNNVETQNIAFVGGKLFGRKSTMAPHFHPTHLYKNDLSSFQCLYESNLVR